MPPYIIERHDFYPGMEKQASSGRKECIDIMQRIYEEDPSYWPYGLGIRGHHSLYLIKDAFTKKAAGFVGWQEQCLNGHRVGSYTIGILPEFRGKGFAKEAVTQIINENKQRVDEVRAYVMPHNKKSLGLAASIGLQPTIEF